MRKRSTMRSRRGRSGRTRRSERRRCRWVRGPGPESPGRSSSPRRWVPSDGRLSNSRSGPDCERVPFRTCGSTAPMARAGSRVRGPLCGAEVMVVAMVAAVVKSLFSSSYGRPGTSHGGRASTVAGRCCACCWSAGRCTADGRSTSATGAGVAGSASVAPGIESVLVPGQQGDLGVSGFSAVSE